MDLKDKLFLDVVHYKVHVPTGKESTISETTGVPQSTAKRWKLKAQRDGYRYFRDKREYVSTKGDFEYHLIFA